MKKLEINISDIKSFEPLQNRILEILTENNISPLLTDSDVKFMRLESEQHWFNILKNIDQPHCLGPTENLSKICNWLETHSHKRITACDIYGTSFLCDKDNWMKCPDNFDCKWK